MDDVAGTTRARGLAASRNAFVRRPLSTSLLWLTVLSVMVAEIFIFVPSVAHFRLEWLRQKLETAAAAGLTAEQPKDPGEAVLGPRQQAALLRALQADLVAIASGGTTRLLARKETIAPLDRQIDIGRNRWPTLIAGAMDTLIFGGNRTIRVVGPVGDDESADRITAEVVLPERKLRAAMLTYARNVFFVSILIALFAASLVYAAITLLLIRPIRAMTEAMLRFGEAPTDASRLIRPSGRPDEIGAAEAELAGMQTTLAATLREQRHLAELGLAVSKINHDLRNILASAQMVSDRLSDIEEPQVQRALPLLLRSLDRALVYTQSVMSYGKAVEGAPVRRHVRLHRLVADVFEVAPVSAGSDIELVNAVPKDFEIEIDADQFFRAINNLCRNAVQALESETDNALVKRVTVRAETAADGDALIRVEDTGPGLPPRARENLFRAFRGSGRAGGMGLGLAIAAEIVEAHGGRILLVGEPRAGACFEIRLPVRAAVGQAAEG